MIIRATFSKPTAQCEAVFGAPYMRIKIKTTGTAGERPYLVEFFTRTQVFHARQSAQELDAFIEKHAGKTFKNCSILTDTQEITILANKKGKISTLRKTRAEPEHTCAATGGNRYAHGAAVAAIRPAEGDGSFNRRKNYLLPEGVPVPFLVRLGIMTAEGKVIAAKYAKFRQINRFLEFVDDMLPALLVSLPISEQRPLRIVDFGCGKSYLTFAVYDFLTRIKKIPAEIIGLDLKKDAVAFCAETAAQLGYTSLHFAAGNIADYPLPFPPDFMITLHACDTATDLALAYAVKAACRAILCVPCCQHELNAQLGKTAGRRGQAAEWDGARRCFLPLLKHGLIKERFAALLTDALRAEYLEAAGYAVQLLEFVDAEHTPKNILIRALRDEQLSAAKKITAEDEARAVTDALELRPSLQTLLNADDR